jgi:CRP/FNR family transcriptional regulator
MTFARPGQLQHPRPLLLDPQKMVQVCATCDARAHSVCDAVPDRDLDRLARSAVTIQAAAGESFVNEGDPAEHFFNISAGTAKLYKLLPDGRRQILGFAGPGHFLGLGLGAATTYAFSAEAVEPVAACRFTRSRLVGLMEDFPAMEKRLLAMAANELAAAQEQMLLLGRKTARERVATFLVARAHLRRVECPTGPVSRAPLRLHLPMTRGDIADYLGLTIETVSRTLTRLRADRLIDLPTTAEVVIPNLAALESVAGGEE